MKTDVFQWLQDWYQSQTNGDWEHQYGIKIETLDNPGWTISIDLTGTGLEKKAFECVNLNRTEHDWVCCRVENNAFKAECGPKNLNEAIEVFQNWQSLNRWKSVKRVETQYGYSHTHYNKETQQPVPTPHVHDQISPGEVRPAQPDELPK